jgi:hypothetical protein
MKIKLGELKSIEESLKTLINMTLPIKVSYSLGKVLKKISNELVFFEEEKNKLIRTYGTENVEKNVIEVTDPKKIPDFTEKVKELLDIDVDLEFEKIDLALLEGKELSPADMINLEMFFKVDE